MANTKANRNLFLLANVALGTYSLEEQQPNETTPEDHLPQEGQLAAHTASPNTSAHDDEQSAQVSPDQGPHAINTVAAAGKFAPAHSHLSSNKSQPQTGREGLAPPASINGPVKAC